MHVWRGDLKERNTLLKPFTSVLFFWVSLLCNAKASELWNVTPCLWLSANWQLYTASRGGEETLEIVSGFGRYLLLTSFKPHRFKVIRKSSVHSASFLHQRFQRVNVSPSTRPLLPHIISPSTSILILLSFVTLLIVSLGLSVTSLHSFHLIYLSVKPTPPLLHLCFCPSICISACLSSGDTGSVISITSSRPCPLTTYTSLSSLLLVHLWM